MAACAASQRQIHAPPRRTGAARPRRLAPVAAVAPAGGPATRASRQQQLVSALLEAARREVLNGWLADLVLPLIREDPIDDLQPPPATRPPQALAGPDGRFVMVDGVGLHYREAWPAGEPMAGSSSSSRSGSSGSDREWASSSGAYRSGSGSGAAAAAIEAAAARPAILLVHGFNGSTFSWRTTLQPLADATGCRVIAFDRPPFGLAERPLEWGRPGDALQYNPYTPAGAARLAEGLLAALSLPSVVAVGHSAGALVCMELALRAPQRIAGLGFVAPALPTTPDRSFQRQASLGQQLRFLAVRGLLANDVLGLRYVRRQLLKRRDEVAAGRAGLSSADGEETDQVIDGYLLPLQAQDWDRAALLNLRAFAIPPAYDYSALTAPVLLVAGSEDGPLTDGARVLAGLLQARPAGSTQCVELQGIGHIPMDECPRHFNRLLAEFVRQQVLQQDA